MSFLNPFLLFGLPLAALPIIIHLINRQRHRTLPWGAMMFLLDAKRLQRSMAKLRYWLIMAMRVLSIIGLIFAVSRPLSTGWLGASVGNQADTVMLLLDRSPSMEQQDPTSLRSKRETALAKFADLLKKTGEGKRVVLVESNQRDPEEVSVEQLLALPNVSASDTEANIPAMILAASEYLATNSVAQADIWIASDLRAGDWDEDDGRWAALRDTFAGMPGVRFHLLSYPTLPEKNFSIRVLTARRRELAGRAELVLQFQVAGGVANASEPLLVEFLVNGSRSVVEVQENKGLATMEHTIPLDAKSQNGWGKVSLPADENVGDNEFYFVFGAEPVRRVTIVSDDEAASRPLRVASMAGYDPTLEYEVVTLPSSRVAEIDWQKSACLIWHANLPIGTVAAQVDSFLASGRPVLCLPPESPGGTEFGGQQWGMWKEVQKSEPIGIGYWDNEADLLAKTQSGDALPVGKQTTQRYCELMGTHKALARFTNEAPLLVRADADRPLYFLTTLPKRDASSLAEDGVVLYSMLQRAIEIGASTQGAARIVETGSISAANLGLQTILSPIPESTSSGELTYYAGCHQVEESWLALNRGTQEDRETTISEEAIAKLFAGLDYQTIQDEVGSTSALANEIWRLFLLAMALALIAEAMLCLA